MNKIISLKDENNTSKEVFVKDMLFATLDTSLRRGNLPNGQDFLLTDTVGFVSKLPTKLVEAFKGTLEEVQHADLLIHVIDASNEDLDIQIKTTYELLKDLQVLNKPIISVFNKIDKADVDDLFYDSGFVGEKIFISAFNNNDINKLLDKIQELLPQKFKKVKIKLPYDKQNIINYFMENYNIISTEYAEKGTILELTINSIDYDKYKEFIIE